MTTSSPTSTPLIGLRVLVTRPAAQADALVAHLQAAGAEVRRLPLLTIQPPPDTATAAAQLADQSKADLWIFTSANAVRGAQTLLDAARWQPDKILAIGAATAQVLAALGHAAECPPADSATSEGLLQLPRLQALAGQRIAIVTCRHAARWSL
jgi:uroporphyrinogen-III synthase